MQLTMSRVNELLDKKAELSPLTEWEAGYTGYGSIWAIAMAIGILASLYFMWSVRHPAID
jgi:hypothetical protein